MTYGTASDLFFSGHTAIAVYGCLELAHACGPIGVVVGITIAVIEVCTVLILRAHYTMDVLCAVAAAFCASSLAGQICTAVGL